MYQNTQCRYRWCQVHHQCQTVCQVCGWSSWHSCPDWYWRGHESWVSNHCSLWPGSSFPFVFSKPNLSLMQYVRLLSDDLKSQKCIMVDFTNILLLALSMGVATNGWRNLISKCYCLLKFHIKGKSCQKYSSVITTATTRVLLFSLYIVNLSETPPVLTPPLPLCTYNITNFIPPSSPSWSCSDLCEWF